MCPLSVAVVAFIYAYPTLIANKIDADLYTLLYYIAALEDGSVDARAAIQIVYLAPEADPTRRHGAVIAALRLWHDQAQS